MAMSTAYWINTSGQILEIPASKHIAAVVQQPEKFGLTKEYIQQKFAEYGEPVGIEGKAREEIIRKLVEDGFVRVRLYRNYWSITINKLDTRTKNILGSWAEIAKENKQAGQYMDVKILELTTDKMHTMTVRDVYFELYESSFNLIPVNSLCEFTTPRLKFKEYILL